MPLVLAVSPSTPSLLQITLQLQGNVSVPQYRDQRLLACCAQQLITEFTQVQTEKGVGTTSEDLLDQGLRRPRGFGWVSVTGNEGQTSSPSPSGCE